MNWENRLLRASSSAFILVSCRFGSVASARASCRMVFSTWVRRASLAGMVTEEAGSGLESTRRYRVDEGPCVPEHDVAGAAGAGAGETAPFIEDDQASVGPIDSCQWVD